MISNAVFDKLIWKREEREKKNNEKRNKRRNITYEKPFQSHRTCPNRSHKNEDRKTPDHKTK